MKITSLPQYKRHAKRFTEALTILGRYGLAGWIGKREPELLRKLFTSADGEHFAGCSRDERIRMALADLGTTYTKLGQILSTRADLVGPELAAELGKLQADTPADPPDVVRASVEAELGRTLEEAFATFEPQALASASIGQVHAATLHDGSRVVVKVQHAGVQEQVESDLEVLQAFAGYAEQYVPALARIQPRALAAAFRRTLLAELDYGRELRNTQVFARNFAGDPGIHFARVHPGLSTRRVLTMERLDGYSVARIERLEADRIDRHDVAWRGANVYLEMIFRDGLYHADPHPGNIFVLEGGVIGLLDCGMVGRIDERLREELEGLLIALADKDDAGLVQGIMAIADVPQDLERDALRGDVRDFLDTYGAASLDDFDLSGALTDLLEIVRRHHLVLTPPVSMLIKVLVMLEGTSRLLDPQFSLVDLLRPYYAKAIRRRLDPRRFMRNAQRAYRDWDHLARELPRRASAILERFEEGKIDLHVQHRRLDAIVNRAVVGLLAAAMLVSSAWLWSAKAPPVVGGISLAGASAFAMGLWFTWRLMRAIRATGDLRPRD